MTGICAQCLELLDLPTACDTFSNTLSITDSNAAIEYKHDTSNNCYCTLPDAVNTQAL